jgi:hypothetical protein
LPFQVTTPAYNIYVCGSGLACEVMRPEEIQGKEQAEERKPLASQRTQIPPTTELNAEYISRHTYACYCSTAHSLFTLKSGSVIYI